MHFSKNKALMVGLRLILISCFSPLALAAPTSAMMPTSMETPIQKASVENPRDGSVKYDFAPAKAGFERAFASARVASKKEGAGALVPNVLGRKIADSALQLLGSRYVWGGNHEKTGLDCSGFVRRAYQQSVGVSLPRAARDMAHELPRVEKTSLRAGDLVFFQTTGQAFSHVGVYMGGGYFAHAPRKGAVSRLDSLSSEYWGARFRGARRPLQGDWPER